MTKLNLNLRFFAFLAILSLLYSCEDSESVDNNNGEEEDSSILNVEISEIIVGESNADGTYRMITFDMNWDNSWRTSNCTSNWDAVWLFIKFKVDDGEWNHATLSNVMEEHVLPPGYAMTMPNDGKGIFLYNSIDETGSINASDVSIRWNYGQDNVSDNALVDIKILGIEMVYIPEGSFYAGDNGTSYSSLTKGSNDNRPWYITNENAIEVTNTVSDGYYYKSSKDYWNDTWNASEDESGTSFTIPAEFPKGYRAIYCMKYELSQQQYVDFLNTLNSSQAANRYDGANYNRYGYTIQENEGVFSTSHPQRACGFISPADGFAFADWAGLRPMSELEFEKICRGSENPAVNGEFAWGTPHAVNAISVNGTESDREYISSIGANSYYAEENINPEIPLNVGIFAGPGKARWECGATFYGVMEMSGNLCETCISIGNSYGRVFSHHNGDGQLAADGFADENNWPLRDGKGAGYKGGNFAREMHEMRVSERLDATVEMDYDHRHIPLGFRAVRSIYE